jgi:hypothetical protein
VKCPCQARWVAPSLGTMRHILLNSLLVGLDDLLDKRLPALQSFPIGAATVKLLTTQRNKITALPAVLTSRPLAEELAIADEHHDGFGGAMWFFVEAHLRHPDTTPARVDAAKRIRAAFIPALDELSATYEAQVKAAKDHNAALPQRKSDLDLFPVDGGTLYDWAVSFVAAGEKLDTLLSSRSDAKDRATAAKLRTTVIGTLTRLRKSLAAEQEEDASLPADLDAQVFSYFDDLEAKAAAAAAQAKKAEAAAQAKKANAAEPAAPMAAPPAAPAADGSIVGNG